MDNFNFKDDLDEINVRVNSVEDSKSIPYDENKFHSYMASPKNVPNDVIHQLSEMFDGNSHFQEHEEKQIGPSTSDRIKESLAVVYILEDGIPVAGAVLEDPTIQNYKGIVPKDYYELKSGQSLNGRVLQTFFQVLPSHNSLGIAGELKRLLEELAPKMFVIVAKNDRSTQTGLFKNDYKIVSEFQTDWENVPVQLWIN